ncbi:hypothetical protein [Rubritalea tangerina]|uniref:hypothetical protein n=1 Tax=Rubritalea tangerina TaxID=430798 RepID=UPI00360BDDFA
MPSSIQSPNDFIISYFQGRFSLEPAFFFTPLPHFSRTEPLCIVRNKIICHFRISMRYDTPRFHRTVYEQ